MPASDKMPSGRARWTRPWRAARRRRVPPDGDFQPIVVRDLRAVTVINGRGSRMVDAIVAFSEKSITASDSRNGRP